MEPPAEVPLRGSDPGRVGPYILMSVLGSGGMGRVYLGRNAQAGGGLAAVKVIRPEYAEDPQFRKRFEREVGALDRVKGAHTVGLLGSGSDGDLLWVATEYIPGPTLTEAVEARGPIGAEAAWRLAADLGRAIEAIWRAGIVHRDLKPSNVILASDGARVIDFGVVQAVGATQITTTGQNVGTPAFMSPEQVRGKEVTAASDVFSLASALTFALAGKAPFGDGTGVDILHRVAFEDPKEGVLDEVEAVDAELAAFIRSCLVKDPELRPTPETVFRTAIGHQLSEPAGSPRRAASRSALAGLGRPALRRAKDDAPGPSEEHAPQPAAPGTASPSPRRRRIALSAAAAVIALVVGGTAMALRDQGGDASAEPLHGSTATVTDYAPAPGATPTGPSVSAPTSADATQDQAVDTSPSSSTAKDPSKLDIRSAACPSALTSGDDGNCVTALQLLLRGYGLDVTADGRFGASTLAAVKVFQTEAGLVIDGRVGAETKKSLYGQPRGPLRTGTVTVTESVDAVSVDRCLDADPTTASQVNETIQVWTCTGAARQRWALYPVPGQKSRYVVVNTGTHRCLDADAGTLGQNGQRIYGRTCAGLPAQRWTLGSGASGGQTLVSVPDGFCLDADAATSGKDGQIVQGFGCAGSVNQVWTWR